MKAQNIIIAHPNSNEQIEAMKAFMKALKIKFEVSKESVYNADFVKKIEKSKKEFENGEFTRVEKEDLQNFLGLE